VNNLQVHIDGRGFELTVSLDLFDGVEQTHIVFDLCPQIVKHAKNV
jgi:hypothetical protein